MNPLHDKIESINKKIGLLLDDYNKLFEENCNLKNHITDLQNKVDFEKRKSQNLEGNLVLLKKTAGNSLSNDESQNLDLLLDQYLKEIDKCIASLNVQ